MAARSFFVRASVSRGLATKASAQNRRSLFVALKGMSIFSNRVDAAEFVQACLGGDAPFADGGHRIFPSVDHMIMPSGNWILQLTESQVAAGALERLRLKANSVTVSLLSKSGHSCKFITQTLFERLLCYGASVQPHCKYSRPRPQHRGRFVCAFRLDPRP